MKKIKVIKPKNIRLGSPFNLILIGYLLFQNLNVPEWLYGVGIGLSVLMMIGFFVSYFNTEEIDLFNENDKQKKSFKEKLKELQQNRM